VGTYVHLDPRVEAFVCRKLGLRPAEHSTQVVPRDHHAEFASLLAVVGASLERMAMEVRHLQRTEVLEAEEHFAPGQKGSSAMPHKRNPIASERICGMARLLRGYAGVALEDVALWHERDISHSSAERVALADACLALDFMLSESCKLFEHLLIYPARMRRNLALTRGCIFSQRVLLALLDSGMPRTKAYEAVQRHALATWAGGDDLRTRLARDPEIARRLKGRSLDACFDLKPYLARIGVIARRLGL
jgi:adenylosuccinate lyase